MSAPLSALATTIRSKNAGVDQITFDVIPRDRQAFERVRDSGVFDAESVAGPFGIEVGRGTRVSAFEPANAIKFTIRRRRPSGTPGECDMFGCQYCAPLFSMCAAVFRRDTLTEGGGPADGGRCAPQPAR